MVEERSSTANAPSAKAGYHFVTPNISLNVISKPQSLALPSTFQIETFNVTCDNKLTNTQTVAPVCDKLQEQHDEMSH